MSERQKLVVVDDDIKVTTLLEKGLTQKGFQVFTAGNGIAGMRLIREKKPAVVITDILQPGMDGVSLCNAIKTSPDLSGTKVIFITGIYTRAGFKADAGKDCSPDGFIEKPIDMTILTNLVVQQVNQYADA